MDTDFFDLTGEISQLWVFPIKSCAGISVQSAWLLPTGLAHDRAFMLVDPQGRFLSQREIARMALIQPAIDGAVMTVTAPGMAALRIDMGFDGTEQRVRVWSDEVTALMAPAAVNQWFSQYLQTDCHLVRMAPTAQRWASTKWTRGVQAPTQFADGYPLLVIGQASLDQLNQRLATAGHAPVVAERFRANMIVSGFQAHDEDRIESLAVQLGDAASGQWLDLPMVKPCTRCRIPDIDPATADSAPAVSDTLMTYRQNDRLGGAITFGVNAIAPLNQAVQLQIGRRVGGAFQFAD